MRTAHKIAEVGAQVLLGVGITIPTLIAVSRVNETASLVLAGLMAIVAGGLALIRRS